MVRFDGAAPGQPRDQRYEVIHDRKKAAEAVPAERLGTARKGGFSSADSCTVAELAERFIAEKRVEREKTTANLCARQLRCHVLPTLGGMKVP